MMCRFPAYRIAASPSTVTLAGDVIAEFRRIVGDVALAAKLLGAGS
jgi:hypothetical protein